MKNFIVLIILFLSVFTAYSQDFIITKNNKEIKCKIDLISEKGIFYYSDNGIFLFIKSSKVRSYELSEKSKDQIDLRSRQYESLNEEGYAIISTKEIKKLKKGLNTNSKKISASFIVNLLGAFIYFPFPVIGIVVSSIGTIVLISGIIDLFKTKKMLKQLEATY